MIDVEKLATLQQEQFITNYSELHTRPFPKITEPIKVSNMTFQEK